MFFDDAQGLLRVLVVGPLAYAALVLVVRTSGKRTLSKMNAFDLVITVSLGSSLATIVLSKDVALLEGFLALAVLVGLQFAVAWGSLRSAAMRRLVKSEPQLLYFRGAFQEGAMQRERVTEGEVRAAARAQGIGSMADVEAVVLETAGDLSVIPTFQGEPSALEGVGADAPPR